MVFSYWADAVITVYVLRACELNDKFNICPSTADRGKQCLLGVRFFLRLLPLHTHTHTLLSLSLSHTYTFLLCTFQEYSMRVWHLSSLMTPEVWVPPITIVDPTHAIQIVFPNFCWSIAGLQYCILLLAHTVSVTLSCSRCAPCLPYRNTVGPRFNCMFNCLSSSLNRKLLGTRTMFAFLIIHSHVSSLPGT